MSGDHNMNLYGDGTVYRGERSADSKGVTYTMHDLISAKGVSEPLREAVKALQKEHGALCAAVKTLQGEKAELIEALCQPSYEEENRLRAEVDRLRAELSTEKEWVEEYRRQASQLSAKIEAMKKSVPEKVEVREDEGHIFSRGSYNEGYDNGWNDCREAMLAAAPEVKT